ncbi:MAG: hypothetical protein JSS39_01025 [Nitrospira sp.]|nr:hypothetical protein [Nitrospira sp.]
MRQVIPEPAILTMRHRHAVMSMDEIRTVGQPAFSSWGGMLFVIDDPSHQNLIALQREQAGDMRSGMWIPVRV